MFERSYMVRLLYTRMEPTKSFTCRRRSISYRHTHFLRVPNMCIWLSNHFAHNNIACINLISVHFIWFLHFKCSTLIDRLGFHSFFDNFPFHFHFHLKQSTSFRFFHKNVTQHLILINFDNCKFVVRRNNTRGQTTSYVKTDQNYYAYERPLNAIRDVCTWF